MNAQVINAYGFPIKVYWGITATRSYRMTIPAAEAVIISACGLWTGKRFMRKRHWIWSDWVLDSGGFIALDKWGEYPFSPDDYLKLVDERKPSWAASMDYPCEPDIARKSMLSNAERIEKTVDLAAYLCKRNDRIVPVVQGYTVAEYADCIRQMDAKELSIDRVAVGSLCRRQRTAEIATLAWELRQMLPQSSVHLFGVKISALAHPEVWALADSIDTNAWEAFKRWTQIIQGEKMSDSEAWEQYAQKLRAYGMRERQLTLYG